MKDSMRFVNTTLHSGAKARSHAYVNRAIIE